MIPQLSTEVTSHIMQLSLPRLSFDSSRERADLFLSFSLVNRTWRELARQDLYKHIAIGSPEVAECFFKALEEDGAAVGERARSLRLGTREQETWLREIDMLIELIVQSLPNLVEVWAKGVGPLQLSAFAADSESPSFLPGLVDTDVRRLAELCAPHLRFSDPSPVRGPSLDLYDCRPFPSLSAIPVRTTSSASSNPCTFSPTSKCPASSTYETTTT